MTPRTAAPISWAVDRRVLVALVVLFALLLAIRVLSPNVEIDEAHFFDQRYWAWGYEGSQPPLYTWLVNAVAQLTGGAFVPAVAAVKFTLNAITWVLMYRLVADIAGRREPALLAVAAFALMPQVVWQAQVTLAHSVLVLTGSVGVLYGLHLAMTRGTWGAYAFLGAAAAVGFLAKYSFGVFLATAVVAAATLPDVRRALSGRKLAVSATIMLVLCAPHMIWAIHNWAETTERMQRIYATSRAPDVPWIGLDGFIWLLYALATSTGPAWLVWLAAIGPKRLAASLAAPPGGDPLRAMTVRLYERMLVIGLGATTVSVLAADVHMIEGRYLIPLLVPFAPWMALRFGLEDRAPHAIRRILAIGGALLLILPVAYALKSTAGRDRLTVPYRAVADDIAATYGRDVTVEGRRQVTEVNVALHLGQPRLERSFARVVLVIEMDEDAPWGVGAAQALERCGYRPVGEPRDIRGRHGLIGPRTAHFRIQAFDPGPASRVPPC